MSEKISKENYKGVRDFYPQDQFVQNYIFSIWKKTLESFGYEEYGASILESAELYKAKSGDEIVNEQTYTFTDRGDREVTLRPEMTPTIARMIAKKRRDLVFPLRWFSIPNLFRYERPQRGRLREHFQLNADIFGIDNIEAEIEIIYLAYSIMINFGLKENQFEIKINNRALINKTFSDMGIDSIQADRLRRLIDKKDKIDDFEEQSKAIVGKSVDLEIRADEKITKIIGALQKKGVNNIKFSPNLMRGFDYYTGIVFEVFDTSEENNRSIFGGGRYDDLLDIFGEDKIPAVGFGMGDVTIKDVLETYDLIPEFKSKTDLYICVLNDAFFEKAAELAQKIRENGVNVAVDYTNKKVGEQISRADKRKIPYIVCVGENEFDTNKFKLKNLKSGKEKILKENKIAEFIKKSKI